MTVTHKSVRAEQVFEDVYEIGLLCDVPFDPPKKRGTVLGILGKLRNEKPISEDEERRIIGSWKKGLTPSERIDALKILWKSLLPNHKHESVVNLVNSILTELYEHDISIVPALIEEARLKDLEDAKRAKENLRRKAEYEAREKSKAQTFAKPKAVEQIVEVPVEPKELTPEEILAGSDYIKPVECIRRELHLTDCDDDGDCNFCGTGIQKDDTDDDDTDEDDEAPVLTFDVSEEASFEELIDNQVTIPEEDEEDKEEEFICELCKETFPKSLCVDFEDLCICPSCHDSFSEVSQGDE